MISTGPANRPQLSQNSPAAGIITMKPACHAAIAKEITQNGSASPQEIASQRHRSRPVTDASVPGRLRWNIHAAANTTGRLRMIAPRNIAMSADGFPKSWSALSKFGSKPVVAT